MQYNTQIMEIAPMQIYSSSLLFSPQSLIFTHFSNKLSWIKHVHSPVKESHWSPRLQKIEKAQAETICSNGTNLLVVPSALKTVQIWDMATGKQIHALNHAGDVQVQQAVFSSDLNHVFTIAGDRFHCWDARSGAVIHNARLRGHDIERFYAISNDGKFVASCKAFGMNEDGRIFIYHTVDGTKLQLSYGDTAHQMGTLKWSNNAKFLAVTTGFTTRIWEVPSGKERLELLNHDDSIRGMPSFSGDSKFIAFPVGEGFEVWDLEIEEKILNISAESSWEVEIVEFSKDSRLIAETRYRRDDNGLTHYHILIWEITSGMKQHELRVNSGDITGIAWSDDGQTLAVAFSEDIELYDLTEHAYWDFNDQKPSAYQAKYSPYLVTFSPDFKLVATAMSYVAVWDTTTGYILQAFDGIDTRDILRLQFSRDGKSIYMYSEVDGLQKWDVASDSLIHKFPASLTTDRKNGTAFSFDGKLFATESKAGDEMLLWNLNKAEKTSHSMTFHKRGLENKHLLAFSQNAKYLVSAEYLAPPKRSSQGFTTYIFTIWNVETGEELWATNVEMQNYNKVLCERCTAWGRKHESIVISNDGATVLFTERARHGMWVLTRAEETRFKICCQYFDPSFDGGSSTHILTQLGCIALDNLIAQADKFAGLSGRACEYHSIVEGYGVSLDRLWITWNGKNVLWLPPDYRLTVRMARSRHCIVMMDSGDNPCILRFSGPPPFAALS